MSERNNELCFLSAAQLCEQFGAGTLSPVEVTDAVLSRIDDEQPTYNAMCLVDHEAALSAARASESRWQRGAPLSVIDGVPATVKDLVTTRGWPTLRGSLTVDRAGPWDEDAPAVDKLRRAGAVLLGKTTTPEFGSKGVTESRLTGTTRNAVDPDRTSGGSSGGAAVAAARGYGVLHIGTDAAGSVRIPAAFNGVFTIKPTFGRVPAHPISPIGTVSHLGPITRTVEDAACMLSFMAQADDRDWYALPADGRDYRASLSPSLEGMRVAWSEDLGYARVNDDVAAACTDAVRRMEQLGARVDEIESPLDGDPAWIINTLWFAAYLKITQGMDEATVALMDPMLQDMYASASRMSAKDLLLANTAREAVALKLCRLHRDYDYLVTPTMPQTAFATGRFNPWGSDDVEDWIRWSSFTYPFNLSQQPAVSCPCGFDRDGLPIGLQIVGPKYADQRVLDAARALELAG